MPFRELLEVGDDELHERFVQILGRTYTDQTWEAVEPFARQAWSTVAWREPRPWEQVKDRVRSEWMALQDRG